MVDPHDRLVQPRRAGAGRRHDPAAVRGNEDPMLERRGLGDDTEQVPGPHGSAFRDARHEFPRALALQCGDVAAARDQRASERVVAVAGERLERALGAVEDVSEQAGAELHLQRPVSRTGSPTRRPAVSS